MDQFTRDLAPGDDVLSLLSGRLGPLYARQRLGLEAEQEAKAAGRGRRLLRADGTQVRRSVIRAALSATGLYGRGRRNAAAIEVRHNSVRSPRLPRAFDGFTILHLSDLHADISEDAMARLIALLPGLRYDVAVVTGDFRGRTYGPFERAMDCMQQVRQHVRGLAFGVLGNHDSIRMVPALEAMGIRMLLNEAKLIARGGDEIHLAGVDDAHFFRLDNIERAGEAVPRDAFAVLLSHSPEIYRQAAHAGFDLMLSGHTHGGQICLPGGVPLTLSAKLPRRLGAGAWQWQGMAGYTSAGAGTCIVPVRLNCRPEITLHRLECGGGSGAGRHRNL
jgi:predicted MPP superfamily phosphohydrolase